MHWRVGKFLDLISDGAWHTFDILPNGVGTKTVDACIERGLVRTKRVDRKRRGNIETYRIALRITRKGKMELKNGH
jgi:hypothetical protein